MGGRTTSTLTLPDGSAVALPLSDLVIAQLSSQRGANRLSKALNLQAEQEREARELARIAKQPRTTWLQIKRENGL